MKRKILCLWIALCILFSTMTAFATENTITENTTTKTDTNTNTDADTNTDTENTSLPLTAESAILIDAHSGQILYEKNAYAKQYPASITKLMTLLLAFEHGDLKDKLTFSHDAVFTIEPGSSHIAVQEDEVLTLEQVIYGIMLQSANECSNGVAEYVDGSVSAFTKHMTERAKELGCKNTNFVNPHGLHDENHYTTAYDMALIAKELLQNETYRSMMHNTYYEIPPTNKQTETRYLHGQHQMLNKHSLYYYPEAEGGKTGFTSQALNTLVTYAKKGNTELIAVVLHCNGAQHYVDTKALFDYGFTNFETVQVFSAGELPQSISVTETYQDKVSEKAKITAALAKDVYVTVPTGASVENVTTKVDCEPTISVPVTQGDVLGHVTLSLDGKVLDTLELTADQDVAETTSEERAIQATQARNHIIKIILIILGIIVLIVLLFIGFIRYQKYREKERRRLARKQARIQRLEQYRQQNPSYPSYHRKDTTRHNRGL